MPASVVIPTRDKAASLQLALRCLGRQSMPAAEIIVVNDGCTDATPAVLAQAAADGMPIRQVRPQRSGRAAARNAGADEARAEVIIFVDDDILVPPGFVASHMQEHRRSRHALVHGPLRELPGAARLVEADPADPYSAAIDGGFGRTVVNSLERMVAQMAAGTVPPVAPWLACVGANISLRRETWHQIGGFEEAYGVIWGCEDLELGYRLIAAGASARLAADGAGIHLSHPRPNRWQEHDINLSLFVTQHPDPTVCALPELLSASGSPQRYLDAIRRHQLQPTTGER